MKPTMNRKDLLTKDDIWNAVISVVCACDLPTTDSILGEAFIAFHYYSELESGGHETLLSWTESYSKEHGIERYLNELITALEKIGAHDYAMIERKYGHEMWNVYIALENDASQEEEFYKVIEKADGEYYQLDGKLEQLVEAYFIKIHTDLIDVVDD
ncbi:hypothetical protein A1A1_15588 [Planococcus antarcticus DSM 14505]|uniref:DNA mimic protein DMP19 C-terminal domain-containing protein n=1 Tax=Planococcus antarcticus DSM 14505 TaxID=1185653 RepID=A0A1C7DEM5_9BACL|nr:hypothetical protein [Planococcus antarcticus]ANU09673.1 hypothetical protein BBH88_04850 [Planococcus antarcticus DSM 14505]EIM05511.1 hypothetical protein A1A1_15588 [Planococcus antarcticus DSM 14505]